MTLTALEIKNAKAGMHADGGGLYLSVAPSGAASWAFRYQIAGRRREMGIGSASVVPATEARAKAAELKDRVKRGIDPLETRVAEQQAAKLAKQSKVRETELRSATFRVATERHLAMNESGWRNAKHRQQWENTLKTYAFPSIGDLPVQEITVQHVIDVLAPIWATVPETASRVRMRIEAVLNSAKVMGWRSGENPAIWRGNLDAVLPKRSKVRSVRHHPALNWRDATLFVSELRKCDGFSAKALEFLILTAARSGEVRNARWGEIDFDLKLWVIPAGRMKAGREHRVPLSQDSVSLLTALPRFVGTDLIFPGLKSRPLSDMSLSAVLKRMGRTGITVHGFRSTFRDWAAEHTMHERDAVEQALAHTIENRVEAAYRRGDLLPKRKALMDDWAEWVRT
jgi:integrase